MKSLLQATARRLCKLDADSFGVTLEDLWAERAESYLIDAQEVVEATGAGELLEALKALLWAYRDAVKLHDPNTDDAFTVAARVAIANATA